MLLHLVPTVGGFFLRHPYRQIVHVHLALIMGRRRQRMRSNRDDLDGNWAIRPWPTGFTETRVGVCAKLQIRTVRFRVLFFCANWKRLKAAGELKALTPFPEHSLSLSFVGHFVWSMCGNMLVHVWLTQIRLSPHGVPSRTRPYRKELTDWLMCPDEFGLRCRDLIKVFYLLSSGK